VVGVVELEEQHLVAGHVREVPPLVAGVVVELEPAGAGRVRRHVRVQVGGNLVDEVETVVQPFVRPDARGVAQGERPVLRRWAEDAPDAGEQGPAEAGPLGEPFGIGGLGSRARAGDREVAVHQRGLRLRGVLGGGRGAAQDPAEGRHPVGAGAGLHELGDLARVDAVHLRLVREVPYGRDVPGDLEAVAVERELVADGPPVFDRHLVDAVRAGVDALPRRGEPAEHR
jgi:hypothetical protein